MMRPKIDVSFEKRHLTDPLGNNFRATYTTVKGPGGNPWKFLVRVALVDPTTKKLAKNSAFEGSDSKPDETHYINRTCDTLEECYAALPAAMQCLWYAFSENENPIYDSDLLNQTVWDLYLEYKNRFFKKMEATCWTAAATRASNLRMIENAENALKVFRLGDLADPSLAHTLIEQLAPHPESSGADYRAQNAFSHLFGYFSTTLQVPIDEQLIQNSVRPKLSREAQIHAAYGLPRSLSANDLYNILMAIQNLSPADFNWCTIVATALALVTGLRTAECAALRQGDVQVSATSGISSLYICRQRIQAQGQWIDSTQLKTKNAYRNLALPECLVTTFQKRRNWLLHQKGIAAKRFEFYPLFCESKAYDQPLSPPQLNDAVQKHLRELGISDETIQAFRQIQQYEQLAEDRNDSITYYLLRRTYITLLHTQIPFSDTFPVNDAICYLAGHARTRLRSDNKAAPRPPESWQNDYYLALNQFVATILHTKVHYPIGTCKTLKLAAVQSADFTVKKAYHLEITLENCEPRTETAVEILDKEGHILRNLPVACSTTLAPLHGQHLYAKPVTLAAWPMPALGNANCDSEVDPVLQFIASWPEN